jgi:hypothetical protein
MSIGLPDTKLHWGRGGGLRSIFKVIPTTAKHCVLVSEAKTRHHGLQDVREQAFKYTKAPRLTGCRKVLITDGGRFYLYARELGDSSWSEEAIGYLNVERIRTNHLAPPKTNAIDTIAALTPVRRWTEHKMIVASQIVIDPSSRLFRQMLASYVCSIPPYINRK